MKLSAGLCSFCRLQRRICFFASRGFCMPCFMVPFSAITLGLLGNPGQSSHLKILHLTTSAKFLLLCKVTYLQAPGIGHDHAGVILIQPTPRPKPKYNTKNTPISWLTSSMRPRPAHISHPCLLFSFTSLPPAPSGASLTLTLLFPPPGASLPQKSLSWFFLESSHIISSLIAIQDQ